MGKYASGKFAKRISDRSGMAFPYNEMVKEWNGSLVHISEFEPKQPQLELKVKEADPEALLNSRKDRTEPSVPVLLNINSFSWSAVLPFVPSNRCSPNAFVPLVAASTRICARPVAAN